MFGAFFWDGNTTRRIGTYTTMQGAKEAYDLAFQARPSGPDCEEDEEAVGVLGVVDANIVASTTSKRKKVG